VNRGHGEYLQYLMASDSEALRFALTDVVTKEVILSERVPATMKHPTTYARLWPVVGDRPQRENAVVLTMEFPHPRLACHFKVMHHDAEGTWSTPIDLEFESASGGDTYFYTFHVVAD